jgi:diguanylate cyclase (GGDEF)-like protein/PAS domain S-box-containing protein
MDDARLALLAAAFESSADMMLVTDCEREAGWTIVHANAAFVEEAGYTLDEIVGTSPKLFLGRADRAILDAARDASHRNSDMEMDVPITRKDGSWFWGSWRARTITQVEEKRRRIVTIRNINQRVAATEQLAAHSERLRQLHLVAASSGRSAERQIDAVLDFGIHSFALESGYVGRVSEGIFVWEHVVLGGGRVNPATSRIGQQVPLDRMALRFALEANDVVAINDLHQLGDPSFDRELHSYIGAPLVVRGQLHGGVGFSSHRIRERPFDADDRDVMRLIAALIGNAVERGRQERRLDTLAFYDMLTGLPNRALLADRLNLSLASAKRTGRSFAIHSLDLDHFKAINDRGGHEAGDEALRIVAQRFSSVLRDSDTLARVGGDEFVVLQPEIDGEQAASSLADRLAATLQDPIIVANQKYRIGVTIGIAIFPRDGTDVTTLLRSGDRALYAGKADGRGRVEFAQAAV